LPNANTWGSAEEELDGEYKKYNNNAGFIDPVRHTPQAFSHFTWERSKNSLLVCDIQGVGYVDKDCYTDPQVTQSLQFTFWK